MTFFKILIRGVAWKNKVTIRLKKEKITGKFLLQLIQNKMVPLIFNSCMGSKEKVHLLHLKGKQVTLCGFIHHKEPSHLFRL